MTLIGVGGRKGQSVCVREKNTNEIFHPLAIPQKVAMARAGSASSQELHPGLSRGWQGLPRHIGRKPDWKRSGWDLDWASDSCYVHPEWGRDPLGFDVCSGGFLPFLSNHELVFHVAKCCFLNVALSFILLTCRSSLAL